MSWIVESYTVSTHNSPTRFWETGVLNEKGERVATSHGETQAEAESIAATVAAAPDLLEALQFYLIICGNTCAVVSRESALEMYTQPRCRGQGPRKKKAMSLQHKSFDRKNWVRKQAVERANPDPPRPTYGGDVQCYCGHSASMDHMAGTGSCMVPGCTCTQMTEYKP